MRSISCNLLLPISTKLKFLNKVANKVANFFCYENYWLTVWLTKNKNLYIQPKMEQKCQAHNLKVVGSNPTPATNLFKKINNLDHPQRLRFLGFFCVLSLIRVWLYQPSYQPVVRFIPFFFAYILDL